MRKEVTGWACDDEWKKAMREGGLKCIFISSLFLYLSMLEKQIAPVTVEVPL